MKKVISMMMAGCLLLLMTACKVEPSVGREESSVSSNPTENPSAAPDASENREEGAVVYFTSDISAEGMLAVFEALGWTPTGSVAVKLSTGEPPASNYLRPELIRDVVQAVNGTIPLIREGLAMGMSMGSASALMITGPATKITNLGAHQHEAAERKAVCSSGYPGPGVR